MQYEIDEIIDIFAFYLYLVFTCNIVNCLSELEMPKMQLLKLTFPSKNSTIEQLGSLLTDIDTGQKQENDNYWTILVYIVNDGIQYYQICRHLIPINGVSIFTQVNIRNPTL